MLTRCLHSLKHSFYYKILALTLALCLVFFAGFIFVTDSIITSYSDALIWPFSTIVSWLGTGSAVIVSYFLFPLTFPLISSLFADKIFEHMESTDYDLSVDPTVNSTSSLIIASLKFTLLAVMINLLALVFYLIPVIGIGLYYLVNGYLFGREYFDMAAHRYSTVKQSKDDFKSVKKSTILVGIVITVMFTLPIVNLIAPIAAIVLMTHHYHNKVSKTLYKTIDKNSPPSLNGS